MDTFKKEHLDEMQREAEMALKQIQEGQSAREVMAQIYVDNLESKTMEQGSLMAGAVLETLQDFNNEFKLAANDIGASMDEFTQKLMSGKSAAERCNIWLEIYGAVTAADEFLTRDGRSDTMDIEALLEKVDEKEFTEEEATPELEKDLKERALKAVSESGIMYNALLRQADCIDGAADGETARMVLEMGKNEIEYEGILSMIAYVKIKNGNYEEMPADMTIDQVSIEVAASVEQAHILEQAGQGKIPMEVAVSLLKLLGYVVILKLALITATAGIYLASTLFGALLFVPAILMIGYGLMMAVRKGFKLWAKGARVTTETIGNVIGISVGLITIAMRSVADFVKNNIIPLIDKAFVNVSSFIRGLTGSEKIYDEEVEREDAKVVPVAEG